MGPKRSQPAAKASKEKTHSPGSTPKETKKTIPKKRSANPSTERSPKSARRSGRNAPQAQPSSQQLLRFLLSKEATELSRPEDEKADIAKRGSIKTYSTSDLTPFEELLCAVILSRPISHRLGLRSIRTIFNDPYNFTSAKAVQAAGKEKHHQALWDARTQHKGKTAEQIGALADVVLEKFTTEDDKEGTQLQKALDEAQGNVAEAADLLKDGIKGLGDTGVNIFLRRVQWLWKGVYPFLDERTSESLQKLGLPDEPDELEEMLKEHWDTLDVDSISGSDEETRQRRAFVIILERAIGADLEGRTDQMLEAAASGT